MLLHHRDEFIVIFIIFTVEKHRNAHTECFYKNFIERVYL